MKKQITNFGINTEKKALEQFEECLNEKYVLKASLMPDAHTGYVAPIGGVFITKKYIVPSWVGYDIGCGMIACKFMAKNLLLKLENKKTKIFNKLFKKIPMGKAKYNKEINISQKSKLKFYNLLNKLNKNVSNKEFLKHIKNNGLKQIGTLGSGNHFIEIGYLNRKNIDEIWLVIHSGSRNLGHRIATEYMKIASNVKKGFEETHPLNSESKNGKDYLLLEEFALEFALLNRLEMAKKVENVLCEILEINNLKFELWTNKTHNHCIKKDNLFIHRKGATSSEKNERGVIPGNMRDGSYLVIGEGNEDFLMSSSHGAGRILSRNKAREKIKPEDFKKQMREVVCFSNEKFIDESPDAYKNINEVLEAQKQSIKIIGHIKPIINWKG